MASHTDRLLRCRLVHTEDNQIKFLFSSYAGGCKITDGNVEELFVKARIVWAGIQVF